MHGKRRDMGIHVDGLADARAGAVRLKRLVREGGDPIQQRTDKKEAARTDARRAKVVAVTFDDCMKDYITAQRAAWTPRHAKQWEASLQLHTLPKLGKVPVAAIDIARPGRPQAVDAAMAAGAPQTPRPCHSLRSGGERRECHGCREQVPAAPWPRN
jgi:hypothetical protein